MDCKTYPYSDDYMVYNKVTGRYVLTEAAFIDYGYDIRSQIIDGGAVGPENIVKGFFRTVSDMVYNFIHSHSANNMLQDRLISTLPSLRPIVMQAMLAQAAYVYYNGNLLLSSDPELRARAIDPNCIEVLGMTVPETGASILYTGC